MNWLNDLGGRRADTGRVRPLSPAQLAALARAWQQGYEAGRAAVDGTPARNPFSDES